MPDVEPTSRISSIENIDQKELARQIDKNYEKLANGINTKADVVVRDVNPAASDFQYSIGTTWVNESANTAYILTSRLTSSTVTWTLIT